MYLKLSQHLLSLVGKAFTVIGKHLYGGVFKQHCLFKYSVVVSFLPISVSKTYFPALNIQDKMSPEVDFWTNKTCVSSAKSSLSYQCTTKQYTAQPVLLIFIQPNATVHCSVSLQLLYIAATSKITVRGRMVRSEVCNSWYFCLESQIQHQHKD